MEDWDSGENIFIFWRQGPEQDQCPADWHESGRIQLEYTLIAWPLYVGLNYELPH